MTKSLVSEIYTFIEAYKNEADYNKEKLTDLYYQNFQLNIKYIENENIPFLKNERWFSPIDRTLRRELKSKFNNYWFDTLSYKEMIIVKINYQNGILQFSFPRDRITNTSARIFALWITLPAFLLIIISLIFLKNQTRPITNLAKASAKFGRGEEVDEFKPSGALEIRQAGYEFDKMRKRIIRHLNQRSEMLSGISHDLRTPLTRIKLQLAFIKDQVIAKKLSNDVLEMEKMLNEYLQFARSSFAEKTEKFNMAELIANNIEKYGNKNISTKLDKTIVMNGRKNLIQRCLNNLIDNSIKYSNNIDIQLTKNNNYLSVIIDDDGPGISKKEYNNVFKPFYKIDKSRSDTKSSVGLGMSIASDVVRSHGGSIVLDKSPQNGLRVKVIFPF
ncbi:uncharacterized protein METZ01_LOCUS182453 [marine metagenome]|uniref:histidine kinase n=1 Tax=marine metagenome TaxID=408172 RepID=A0A382CUQ4_9ZZZZ